MSQDIRSHNFSFMRVYEPQFERLGALAERYFRGDPNTCLIKLRQFGELLALETGHRRAGISTGWWRRRRASPSAGAALNSTGDWVQPRGLCFAGQSRDSATAAALQAIVDLDLDELTASCHPVDTVAIDDHIAVPTMLQ
jgi:hypothetical protein